MKPYRQTCAPHEALPISARQSGGVDRARPRLALLLQLQQLGLPQRRQPDGRARRGEILRSRQEEMRPRADRGGVCGRGWNPTLRIRARDKIGRAECRERVCTDGWIAEVAV